MPSALIYGCRGLYLTEPERDLFAAADPLGFILFARNCRDPAQLADLVADLRVCIGRDDAPVLIDQEGGRVTRLGPPHWRTPPAAARFGEIAAVDLTRGIEATQINARLMANDLAALGITVNCAPVLDFGLSGTTPAIGDRAISDDGQIIAAIGRAVCAGLLAGGVLPVLKHVPGHGRALIDSHLDLPRVEADIKRLRQTDFTPFTDLADMPIAMTAHIVFAALDPEAPATQSRIVIAQTIRGEIGFDGLLLSDDISMEALAGTIVQRAHLAWDAGCDIVLHCNGSLEEMSDLANSAPEMNEANLKRWARAQEVVKAAKDNHVDSEAMAVRLSQLM